MHMQVFCWILYATATNVHNEAMSKSKSKVETITKRWPGAVDTDYDDKVQPNRTESTTTDDANRVARLATTRTHAWRTERTHA